ncbi:hypothetical protein [Sphingobacterium sp. LRF_L2]|uniref:hypothetical protein n=1 Tax=Sphingobacterium sp. LRF_L2 TaxID=3369421 RepID=UPI003F5FA849
MEKTTLTWDEILYRRSWTNIKRGLADSPRMVKAGDIRTKKRRRFKGIDELPK